MKHRTVPSLRIEHCSPNDFEWIKHSAKDLQLDDRDMNADQMLVAKVQQEIVGYVRIKEFENFSELCTLGVAPEHRQKGIATNLCHEVIHRARHPLYLVTIIPAFFGKLGFETCEAYPPELNQKLRYCTGSLPVEETYQVMKFHRALP